MNATLLHAVVRVADARTADADLLDRFTRNRDERAFEELVRRHGPLVWGVCRHLLSHHADAEDAFQAVFLALVRGASTIRTAQALPAWLHGVAVRVAIKAKRAAVRRRQREQRVAVPEADRTVPDESWAVLMTAVHEEIHQLPETERTAFVLCDLEGVRQPDAAARLGWPLGTLSGRLCKARQRLLDQLTRRGISPAVLAIGGLAGSVGTVPAALVDQVTSFPTASAAGVSSTVAELARGLVEGATMRMKIMAATLLVAGAMGMSGGALVLSQADAQTGGGGSSSGPPPGMGPGGLPPGAGAPSFPGAGGGPAFGGQGFPGAGGPPGAPGLGPQPGGTGAGGQPRREPGFGSGLGSASTWEYKFVDLKNDDRDAFTKAITESGNQGWEFAGSERLRKGGDFGELQLVLVFKKHKGGGFQFGGGGGMSGAGPGMPGLPGGGLFGGEGGRGGGFGGLDLSGLPGPGGGGGRGVLGGGGAIEALTHKLKSANAADVATVLEKTLTKAKTLKVVPEPNSNTIIIIADPATLKDALKLIEQLDASSGSGGSGGGSGGGSRPPTGGSSSSSSGGRPVGPMGGMPGGMMPPGGGFPGPMGSGSSLGPAHTGELTVVSLRNATAPDMAAVVGRVFPNSDITADPRTNQLIIRADQKTTDEMRALIEKLDVQVPKR